MKKLKLISILLMVAALVHTADACTVIVAGRKATVDGSVLNSHTDCGPDCRIQIVPGQTYPEGAMAPVYYGLLTANQTGQEQPEILGYIPQARQTYTYFHSAYSHINEYQLCIGESTMSQRPELQVAKGEGQQIMTVEQAAVFALQRCKTAREALDLITSLMEEQGFLPSCGPESECLTLADPREVWILELFSVGKGWTPRSGKPGVIWAARRLPDDQVAVIPNWSIIKEIDLSRPDEYRASSNYREVAVEKGWYDPASGRPFCWQEAYAPVPREWSMNRFWLFYETFAPGSVAIPRQTDDPYRNLDQYTQYVEPLGAYPFSVVPARKLSVQDIMAFQRSTFEGTIYDKENDAAWYYPDAASGKAVKSKLATPFPTGEMQKLMKTTRRRAVARMDGEYGMVAQLRSGLPRQIGGVYWVFVDNAYTSPYMPFFTGTRVVPEVYRTYNPDVYSDSSARWAVDFVDNLLYLNWQDGKLDLQAARQPLEASFFVRNVEIEREYMALASKNPRKAAELLDTYAETCAGEIMQTYRMLRNTLLVKYTNNRK